MADSILSIVFDAVKPGNTMNVKIANVPNPTNMGEDIFLLNTFSKSCFMVN